MGVYSIYVDDELVYTSIVTSPEYALNNVKCTLTLGEEGSAEFSMPPTNCRWPYIHRMRSRVKIYEDDTLIFSGRVTEVNTDMQLTKEVSCEGDLALLLDSLHGPYKGTSTIKAFIQSAIASHNEQVEDWKKFGLGDITVDGAETKSVSFDISGYSGTKEILTSQITDVYGGYFQTRIGSITERTPKGNEPFTIELKSGSRGNAVKVMQSRINGLLLNGQHRSYSCGSADGIFGNNTKSGVLGFQRDTEIQDAFGVSPYLQATGIYDKLTHEALIAVINGGYDESVSKDIILLDYLADPYYSVQEESTSTTYENVWNEATDKLKYGMRGDKVKTLQERMIQLGPPYDNHGYVTPSGYFDAYLQWSVSKFQENNGLKKTMMYDKDTHDKLMLALGIGPDDSSNILSGMSHTDKTQAGVTYTWSENGSCHVSGTATGQSVCNLFLESSGLPNGIVPGTAYSAEYNSASGNVYLHFRWFSGGSNIRDDYVTSDQIIFVPSNADSVRIRLTTGINSFTGAVDEIVHPKLTESNTSGITPTNLQSIHFGVNLVEMSGEYPVSDIFTVLLPIGANDITIADVNNGSIYLENAAAVEAFGRIVKSFTWSKATTKQALKDYAEDYLKSHTMVFPDNLTVTALDMHLLDDSAEKIKVGDWVSIVSEPHGIDYVLCVLEMELDLQNPGSTQYKLGYYIPSNFDSDTSERSPIASPNRNSKATLSKSVAAASSQTDPFSSAFDLLGYAKDKAIETVKGGVEYFKDKFGGSGDS